MFEPWVLWCGTYVLVGAALLWFMDDIVGWRKLIFIIWPILAITMVCSILSMLISSICEEINELIRYKQ